MHTGRTRNVQPRQPQRLGGGSQVGGAPLARLLEQLTDIECPGRAPAQEDGAGARAARHGAALHGLSDAALSDGELLGVLRGAARARAGDADGANGAALALWTGELARELADAAAARRLTPEMVALAPAAGPDVWAAAARLLAGQMEAERRPHRAAALLLAAQQVLPAPAYTIR